MESYTVRAYVGADGQAVLKPRPDLPFTWLSELLAAYAGAEVRITVALVGYQPPDWGAAAGHALEGGRPRITVTLPRRLGAGHG